LISTFAPSRTNSSAVARPIPRAEPVTIAALPSSSPISLLRIAQGRAALYEKAGTLTPHAAHHTRAPREHDRSVALEPRLQSDSRRELAARRRERRITALAERQHGVVSRTQLLEAGFAPGAIVRRMGRGRLHPIHRGVYAVGHRVLTIEGRWMAAVLAGGGGAGLSHWSAAELSELRRRSGRGIHVTCRRRCARPGLHMHESELPADELTVIDGIPVTTVARTLLDLAAVMPPHLVQQAAGQAERRLLADSPSLPELLERHRGRRGIAELRRVLADSRLGLDLSRSELEDRFIAFVEARGLPRPQVNAAVHLGGRRFEVDCLWRDRRLVVELDSRAFHLDPVAFENDRARDRALIGAGFRTIRITWRQLEREPDALAADLRTTLSRRTAT
jgi:very-short-patch-repair endonuclease